MNLEKNQKKECSLGFGEFYAKIIYILKEQILGEKNGSNIWEKNEINSYSFFFNRVFYVSNNLTL